MASSIRKNDSLGSAVVRLRKEMKDAHGIFSDYIADLALLTKADIKSIIIAIDKNQFENGKVNHLLDVIEKIENVLLEIEDQKGVMNEVVQVIGGLEFSTTNKVDKLAEILKDQDVQQGRMVKGMNHLRTSVEGFNSSNSTALSDLRGNLFEFQESFSRFQDFVIASVPRIMKVFDELDDEERVGIKYGHTGQI